MTYAIKIGLFSLALAASAVAQDKGKPRPDPDGARWQNLIDEDDLGTRTYVARSFSAAGVRIHFEQFALPEGSAVYVQNADGSERYGPFTGAGPNQDSQFLSPIVHGNTARVVFEHDGDVPAVLPYSVARVEAVDADEVARFDAALPEKVGEDAGFRTSLYRGVPIPHATVGGLAIHEGDILLGETKDLQPVTDEPAKGMERRSFGIPSYPSSLWPKGVIPYVVDSTVVSTSTVAAAVNAWNSTLAGNVKLVKRTTEASYVYFTRSSSASTCSSYVGVIGGAQPIFVGDHCTTGNLIHEIGHAFGLLHEHTRLDRDKYISVNTSNINSTYAYNFDIATYGTDLGSYDYGSIMHYPATAFSVNGLATITTKPAGIAIGQRIALSAGDIAGIKKMYPGSTMSPTSTTTSASNVSVTIATYPAGLGIYVDGVLCATPKTITGAPGATHSIEARATVSAGTGARYLFHAWSNGSPNSWTLTMPTSNATYTATYPKQYKLTVAASTGGTATVTSDSDGWYYAGATVQFSAIPVSGYGFLSWTGFQAGTPASTTLTVNDSYAVTANFIASAAAPKFSATSAKFTAAKSYASVYVYADPSTTWTAVSSAAWVTFSTSATATGSKNLTYVVNSNATGVSRTATIKIGSAVFTITQAP